MAARRRQAVIHAERSLSLDKTAHAAGWPPHRPGAGRADTVNTRWRARRGQLCETATG